MTVKMAKESIKDINGIIQKMSEFELLLADYTELYAKSTFLTDAVAYLGDYKEMLEKAIDMSNLPF